MTRIISIIAALIAALLFASGCAAQELDEQPEPSSTKATEKDDVNSEPASDQPAGTYADPFPAGTYVGDDEMKILVTTLEWNANEIVSTENPYSNKPKDGFVYVLAEVTVENVAASDPIDPWFDINVSYVAPDGRSFDEVYEIIPNDLVDVGDLYPGGVGTGNLLFEIPVQFTELGMWSIDTYFSNVVFVSAA